MKRIIFNSIFVIAISLLMTSCTTDVLNPDPNNGILTGVWSAVETSPTYGTQYYDVEIEHVDDYNIKIYNFYGLGSWLFVDAGLSGSSIILNDQTIEGHRFAGQGIVSSNSKNINMNFTVEEVSVKKSIMAENVSVVYTKN